MFIVVSLARASTSEIPQVLPGPHAATRLFDMTAARLGARACLLSIFLEARYAGMVRNATVLLGLEVCPDHSVFSDV